MSLKVINLPEQYPISTPRDVGGHPEVVQEPVSVIADHGEIKKYLQIDLTPKSKARQYPIFTPPGTGRSSSTSGCVSQRATTSGCVSQRARLFDKAFSDVFAKERAVGPIARSKPCLPRRNSFSTFVPEKVNAFESLGSRNPSSRRSAVPSEVHAFESSSRSSAVPTEVQAITAKGRASDSAGTPQLHESLRGEGSHSNEDVGGLRDALGEEGLPDGRFAEKSPEENGPLPDDVPDLGSRKAAAADCPEWWSFGIFESLRCLVCGAGGPRNKLLRPV